MWKVLVPASPVRQAHRKPAAKGEYELGSTPCAAVLLNQAF